MEISVEITKELKVLNINLEHEGEIIMLSIPTKDNIEGMDKEILFSHFNTENKMVNGGTIELLELFKLFKNQSLTT